jgi:predicted MFS family arabinose efflux permease
MSAPESARGGLFTYENGLLLLLGLTFGFLFFDRNAASYLAPFIAEDLKLNNTQIGLLGSALSVTWAISAYAFGAWSDRTGVRKPFLLASVLSFSLCSFLSGVAQSFGVLLASRLLMGLAEGLYLPVAMAIMLVVSTEKRRGLNMGVMQNLFSNLLGSFVAPLVLVAIAEQYNWRMSFYVAGVPGLICALLIWKYVREPARTAPTPRADAHPGERHMGLAEMLRVRNVWLCVLISCFMVPWMVLGWAFMPVFYVNYRHIAPSDMSILMSVLGASAALGSFVVPALSDRFGRKPIMIGFSFLGVLVPLAALYYTGPLPMLGVLVFIGWLASGVFPLFMGTIPAESTSPRYVATAMGLIVGVGEILGGFGGPTLAGWIADRTSLAAPILMQAGCAVAGGVLALFLKESAPVKVGRLAGERTQDAALARPLTD